MGVTRFDSLRERERDDARALTTWIPVSGSTTLAQSGNTFIVNGAGTVTRGAAGNYFLRRTAAAANHNPWVEMRLSPFFGFVTPTAAVDLYGEDARGPMINSFDLVYALTTEAVDAIVPTFATTAYTSGGTVPTTTARAVTGTATLTTAATYAKINYTVDTPFVLGSTSDLYMILRVDDTTAGGGVFDLYGVFVNYSLLI